MTVHDLRHIRAAVESWRRGSIDADSAMREVAATLDAETRAGSGKRGRP